MNETDEHIKIRNMGGVVVCDTNELFTADEIARAFIPNPYDPGPQNNLSDDPVLENNLAKNPVSENNLADNPNMESNYIDSDDNIDHCTCNSNIDTKFKSMDECLIKIYLEEMQLIRKQARTPQNIKKIEYYQQLLINLKKSTVWLKK
ncbi:MAG: hypothetical protein PHE59_00130 [Patescibacteria group bacterium]|nr:hypothetical protein [Patescibacteria group bacterium]